jgi:hypothetical protein
MTLYGINIAALVPVFGYDQEQVQHINEVIKWVLCF